MQTPEIDNASIVMLGSFNPSIFQPRWLGVQQLIRTEEAENAKITTIQAELADFSTEWFHMQVLQGRFQISSFDPRQYAPLRDLAASIFSILPHTPVTLLGMSRSFHFQMPSIDSWHAIGHLLAPKEHWKPIMQLPGLRSLFMEGRRTENGGVLYVKIEPSMRVNYGLYVEVSEEFKPSKDQEPTEGARWVPDRLTEHWDAILEYAAGASDYLLSLVNVNA